MNKSRDNCTKDGYDSIFHWQLLALYINMFWYTGGHSRQYDV